jgi:hypothetical protein
LRLKQNDESDVHLPQLGIFVLFTDYPPSPFPCFFIAFLGVLQQGKLNNATKNHEKRSAAAKKSSYLLTLRFF